MHKDKDKAIKLRRSGKSYKQIRDELGIAVSTLAGWFKNEPWSQEIKYRLSAEVSLSNPNKLKLMAHATRERWRLKREDYRAAAVREFEKYKNDPLFLAGIMLHWRGGGKDLKSSAVRLVSGEPEMIKIFNLFLTKLIKIPSEKIFGRLILYPDLVDSVQKNFWSKTTGLALEQFKKSSYIQGRHHKKRLSFGVCAIYIQSRTLKERMLKWLELCQEQIKSHALKLNLEKNTEK